MTREEAIALLESRRDLIKSEYPEIDDYREALDMAIKALEQEPRWIPVSERLPKVHNTPYYVDNDEELYESDHVLTCCEDGKDYIYAIGTIIYDKMCNSYEWSGLYDYGDIIIDDMRVIAWMPLPEPYRAESE